MQRSSVRILQQHVQCTLSSDPTILITYSLIFFYKFSRKEAKIYRCRIRSKARKKFLIMKSKCYRQQGPWPVNTELLFLGTKKQLTTVSRRQRQNRSANAFLFTPQLPESCQPRPLQFFFSFTLPGKQRSGRKKADFGSNAVFPRSRV